MRKFRLLQLVLLTALFAGHWSPLLAQRHEVFRAEGLPYQNRHDAVVGGDFSHSNQYLRFAPEVESLEAEMIWMGQKSEIPYFWTDGLVMIHLEAVGQAYTLEANGHEVCRNEDGLSPAEFDLTPYIRQGLNHFRIGLRSGELEHTQQGLGIAAERFAGSYLFTLQKRSIADYRIRLVPDSLRRFGILELDIVARNAFNYEEEVNVAYDIYSPEGKLMDYTDHPIRIAGRSQDTVRLHPFIYHTNEQKWGNGKAPLYRVMLFTKRDGKMWEYMPIEVGFSDMAYRDGTWYRFGEPYTLKSSPCNALSDKKATESEMRRLLKAGFNTLCPTAPQPHWYYELADRLGLYIIDCAAISASEKREDRTVGGTPANDPSLAEEFTLRVKRMYYRSRNHTSVIGFRLANPSGNGYALYKAYQWIKSVESERPVFYEDAQGEWNSD